MSHRPGLIHFVLAAMLCAVGLPGRAQRSSRYIDSLQAALHKAKDDTCKAALLQDLSTAYFYVNTSKGISYGQQGIDLALRLGWKRGMIGLYNTLGNCCSYKQDYRHALDNYRKSLGYAEDLHDPDGQLTALRNIGNVYAYRLRDYQKATDFYARGLRIARDVGNNRAMADLLTELGNVYYSRKEHTRALDYYQQAMAKAEGLRDYKLVAEDLGNISAVYNSQGKYPEALDFALRAQKFLETVNDKQAMAQALLKTGIIYNNQRDYQRAMSSFQRCVKLAEEADAHTALMAGLQYTGDVYMSLGDYASGIQALKRARSLAVDLGDKQAAGICATRIGECYQAIAGGKARSRLPDSLSALSASVRMERSLYFLTRGADVLKEVGDVEGLEETYGHLSEVQYALGDSAAARESYRQHTAYLEGMYNKEKEEEVLKKDMQYVFDKKQETLKQETEQKEMAMQQEMKLSDLRHEYEMRKAAATSEQERQQLIYEEELKQKQITWEYERKQAAADARAALAQAKLEKEKELADLRLRDARRERALLVTGIVLLIILIAGMYNRYVVLSKNKRMLEEKNRQVAAEKEIADKMRVRAENSEKFKQLFLANMSHEIRTPMNAVSGMTAILLEKQPREDQLGYLQAIIKSSEILLHIINDILDLSKIEAGKMELESIDFSLSDALRQVKDTLAHRADEKGLQFLIDIDAVQHDVVVGDPYRLNQILVNLAGNAIKFTEKGSVQVAARQESAPDGRVTVCFSVTDTGIGIPPEKVKNLFANFAQVNASDTRKYGGTGLGLSISRQLVELHGGTIAVESKQGAGTTFSFAVSYTPGSPDELARRLKRETRADGAMLNGLRIILADDNEYNRVVVSETLSLKADVHIDTAVNGQEVLDLLARNDYDVILMDVQMPVMSGTEATEKIRKEMKPPKRDIPIIALTASTMRAEIDRFMAAGMNAYVPKPFKAWQLINALAEVTGRKAPGEPLPQADEDNDNEEMPQADVADTGRVTDREYLRAFCEGDEQRMQKYTAMYLKGVPDFLQKAGEAAGARDLAGLAKRVHAFKPNLLVMGMKTTGELATRIERLCGQKDESAWELLQQLLARIERSVEELNADL